MSHRASEREGGESEHKLIKMNKSESDKKDNSEREGLVSKTCKKGV